MSQVASEAPTPALMPSLPNPAWLGPSSGRAPPTPFESLLDDGGQAAAPPPQSPPPADKTAQTAPTDSSQSSAKSQSQDGDTPQAANTDTAPKTADATTNLPDPIPAACISASVIKTKADAKLGDQVVPDDEPKSAGDGKQADALTPAVHAATVADNSAPAIVPAAGLVVAAASVPVPPALATTAPQATATANIEVAIAAAGTPKSGPAGEPGASAKTSPAPQSGGKPQFMPADAVKEVAGNGNKQATNNLDKQANNNLDKQVTGHPQDETVAGNQHTATAETPPAVSADVQSAAPKALAGAVQQAAQSVVPQGVVQAAASPAPSTQLATPAAVPLSGVAIEIASKALAGKSRFEIRLDPPELGRIEVRLDVDRDGNTTTRLIADRSDTLDLMRNDSAGLQRALQDAGLKTADNGLQFSLRDQTMGRDQTNTPTPAAAQIVVQDDLVAAADLSPRQYSRLAGLGGGVDIRV